MFWRGDPRTRGRPASQDNWPRNGAYLRGTEFEHAGAKWLQVAEIKQAGTAEWKSAPEGAFMMFESDGPLLHDDSKK